MSLNERITEAIADLNTQVVPNLKAMAEKYNLVRSTLTNRWAGKSTSREEAISNHRQCLTNAQERALVHLINRLTDRGLQPTSQIVKNLAEEIRGDQVGKNWTESFVKRHEKELKSVFLKGIDNLRLKGEYEPVYRVFYDLVEYCFLYKFLYYLV
jgi:Tc5 transposase-like DNA-binding protein